VGQNAEYLLIACVSAMRRVVVAKQGACCLLSAVLFLVGCSNSDSSGPPTGSPRFSIVSGTSQTAPINQPLAAPVVVKIVDAGNGAPIPGYPINWVVTSGGGSVFAAATATSADGVTQNYWTLGPLLGAQTLEVRAIDPATGVRLIFGTVTAIATAPVPVPHNVNIIVAGDSHSCALVDQGAAFCWGADRQQLGTGPSGSDDSVADPVAGGLAFTALAAGASTTCGLVAAGAAYCWGNNQLGPVGDGSSGNSRTAPTSVAGGLAFTAISTSGNHTCGLVSTGAAYCWGDNYYGAVGDSTTDSIRSTPSAVRGGLTFTKVVTGGAQSCGLVAGGMAYCWGNNNAGAIGDSTRDTSRLTPVRVAGGLTFSAVVAGGAFTCGLTGAGAAYCWGDNTYGQLGDGTKLPRVAPTAVMGGLTFASLAAGGNHTCGVTVSGTTYCWGYNFYGQLGDGTKTDRLTPTAVTGALSFTALATGYAHTCGITASRVAYCWGYNQYGQVGDGTIRNVVVTPSPVFFAQ